MLREDDSHISESDYVALCRPFIPSAGDVLLAIVGATLGKTAIISDDLGPFHIQRSLALFRSSESIQNRWLHLLFQSTNFQQLLWTHVGFSAQPGIYLGSLAEFQIALPSLDDQDNAIRYVEEHTSSIDHLIAEAEHAILLLKERRSALISAAVTGQIDVRGLAPA